MQQRKRSKGAILILTTILLFVILGMVVSLSYITVMEQKMSGKTKSSVGAFYNSESGVEWALNKIAGKSDTDRISSLGTVDGSAVECPAAFGDDACKVYFLDQDGKVLDPSSTYTIADIKAVRSVGSQGSETQRAIEAAVAATGIGKYQISCANSNGIICCKMDTETGATVCKYTPNTWDGTWQPYANNPWP